MADRSGSDVDAYELEWLEEPPTALSGAAPEPRGGGRVRRFGPAMTLLGAGIMGLIFSVPWVTGGDDGAVGGPTSPPVASAEVEVGAQAVDASKVSSIDIAAALAGVSEADFNRVYVETSISDEGVELFGHYGNVGGLEGGFRLAYIGADGHPIVIDTGSGEIHSITREERATTTDGLALLHDDTGMLGIDADDIGTVWRIADDATVIADATGGLTAIVVDDRGARSVGPFVLGAVTAFSPVPDSSRLAAIPGVGVFVTPQSGGTYEVSANDRTLLTPSRMRSAVSGHYLERRRIDGGSVDVVVDQATGEERILDPDLVDLGGDLLLSPDGRWVFIADAGDGTSVFYDTETHTTVGFQARPGRSTAVWAPDSSYLASVDSKWGRIWVEFTDGRSGAIALGLIDIPGLESTELRIF